MARLKHSVATWALCATTFLHFSHFAAAQQASGVDVNAANNPLTPKVTLNLQDYFVPSINRVDGRTANQFLLRGLMPLQPFGVSQLLRFTLPIATEPTFPTGSDTGLGDLTVFDLVAIPTKFALFGVGPLLVAPTASTRTLGSGKWQGGLPAWWSFLRNGGCWQPSSRTSILSRATLRGRIPAFSRFNRS